MRRCKKSLRQALLTGVCGLSLLGGEPLLAAGPKRSVDKECVCHPAHMTYGYHATRWRRWPEEWVKHTGAPLELPAEPAEPMETLPAPTDRLPEPRRTLPERRPGIPELEPSPTLPVPTDRPRQPLLPDLLPELPDEPPGLPRAVPGEPEAEVEPDPMPLAPEEPEVDPVPEPPAGLDPFDDPLPLPPDDFSPLPSPPDESKRPQRDRTVQNERDTRVRGIQPATNLQRETHRSAVPTERSDTHWRGNVPNRPETTPLYQPPAEPGEPRLLPAGESMRPSLDAPDTDRTDAPQQVDDLMELAAPQPVVPTSYGELRPSTAPVTNRLRSPDEPERSRPQEGNPLRPNPLRSASLR